MGYPPSITFGSAIHEAIGEYHIAMQNGGIHDRNEITDIFRTSFSDNSLDAVFKDDDEFDNLMERGTELASQYIDTFPHIKAIEVEMEFRLPTVNTYTGDLIEKDIVGDSQILTNRNQYVIMGAYFHK